MLNIQTRQLRIAHSEEFVRTAKKYGFRDGKLGYQDRKREEINANRILGGRGSWKTEGNV
jgi:hypothetical protein